MDNLLFFWGEEKPYSGAKEELMKKANDIDPVFFGDIQFMICYAADGPLIRFYAIDGSPDGLKKPDRFIPLTEALNITQAPCRFEVLKAIINLIRVMVTIRHSIPAQTYPLAKRMKLGNSAISFNIKDVMKWVDISKMPYCGDKDLRIEFLCGMYDHAKDRRGLVNCINGPILGRTGVYKVTLSNRCFSSQPKDEDSLRAMTKDVVSGLDWLHHADYLHRDIRHPNILYDPVIKQYILIDFEHGAKAKAEAGNGEIEIYGDNAPLAAWDDGTLDDGLYTAMSEMYQLGKLLNEEFGYLIFSDQGKDFVKKLKEKKMIAEEALKHEWICNVL